MQRGTLKLDRKRRAWFLYSNERTPEGWKKRCERVADSSEDKTRARMLADKLLEPLNAKKIRPESNMALVSFVDDIYFPAMEKRLDVSTIQGYKHIWNAHWKGKLKGFALREFRTSDGQRILRSIEGVGHERLRRIRAFLSGVFTYARELDLLDVNPMHATKAPGRRTTFEGKIFSLAEVLQHLEILSDSLLVGAGVIALPRSGKLTALTQAQMAIALAAFAGLRKSEIRGLRWSDVEGDSLRIRRKVYGRHVGPTKTETSDAPVPLLPYLKQMLVLFSRATRTRDSRDSDYILQGSRGFALSLDTLADRVIIPRFKAHKLTWEGWPAYRRSLASLLDEMGVRLKTISRILRNAPQTTFTHYVQRSDADSRAAMEGLEKLLFPSSEGRQYGKHNESKL